MNESDLIQYLELLGTQIRVLEGRNDITLATLRELVHMHPNPAVLEARIHAWLESPAAAEARKPLSPAELRARRGSALVMLRQLFHDA